MTEKIAQLTIDDVLGVWGWSYRGGQTGKLTIAKKDDGSPKIDVWTSQGGESEAEDIVIERDTLTFTRNINVSDNRMRANYSLRLVDGEFAGTMKFDWQNAGVPFTAVRAE